MLTDVVGYPLVDQSSVVTLSVFQFSVASCGRRFSAWVSYAHCFIAFHSEYSFVCPGF